MSETPELEESEEFMGPDQAVVMAILSERDRQFLEECMEKALITLLEDVELSLEGS